MNGSGGNVGPVAVRDIQLAYPPHGVYEKGTDAVLLGTLVNSGQTDEELVSVTSPAGRIQISGDKKLVAGRSLILQLPTGGLATSSTQPTTSGPATSGSPTTTGTPTTTGSSAPGTSGTSGTSGAPGTSGSSAPTSGAAATTSRPTTTSSAATKLGEVTILLNDVTDEIRSGKTIEVTFTFRGGSVTIPVPVAVPTTPRKPVAGGEGH
nr:hypothetical protein [Kibdelosporangium sp. MJ126-NF4]CTQ94493.1 hypothetical protein [Kibdelosporangium sp. MJ126-NF4]